MPESLWLLRAWVRACGGLQQIHCNLRDELFVQEGCLDPDYARADDGTALLVLRPGNVLTTEVWQRTCVALQRTRGSHLASRKDVDALRSSMVHEQRWTGLQWCGTRWEVSGMVLACYAALAEEALRGRFSRRHAEEAVQQGQVVELARTWATASAHKVLALWDSRDVEQWLALTTALRSGDEQPRLDSPEVCESCFGPSTLLANDLLSFAALKADGRCAVHTLCAAAFEVAT